MTNNGPEEWIFSGTPEELKRKINDLRDRFGSQGGSNQYPQAIPIDHVYMLDNVIEIKLIRFHQPSAIGSIRGSLYGNETHLIVFPPGPDYEEYPRQDGWALLKMFLLEDGTIREKPLLPGIPEHRISAKKPPRVPKDGSKALNDWKAIFRIVKPLHRGGGHSYEYLIDKLPPSLKNRTSSKLMSEILKAAEFYKWD
jgi:hypothetical protein